MTANRPFVMIGNWKMHKTIEEARTFVAGLVASYEPDDSKVIGLAVPYTLIYPLSAEPILIGAQNMNDAEEGAFTGEIAGSMLVDAGAKFVLLGHSERRHLYGESDAVINRKLKRAVEVGLNPVLCVGETCEEYGAEETLQIIEKQLREGLKDLKTAQLKNLIIAYEPVWAIGNAVCADPAHAQEVHHFCREILAKILSPKQAEKTVIQYGGSVNPANAHKLLEQPDIDGLLIGGASLSLDSFLQIVNDRYTKLNS